MSAIGLGLGLRFTAVFQRNAIVLAMLAQFSAAEAGVLFDPSDINSLFQDSGGTTAMYMPGQGLVDPLVGLMLDKRLGLVATGAELCVNGDFSAGITGWNGNTGFISGGQLNFSAATNNQGIFSLANVTSPTGVYQITFTVSGYVAGGVSVTIGVGAPSTQFVKSANGTYTYITAVGIDQILRVYSIGASTTLVVDNISIKAVAGNHATQATAASRPTLSGRVNQILGSPGFVGATITPGTGLAVVATGLADERGGTTARQIRNTVTTEQHRLFLGVATTPQPYTVWVKNVDAGFVQLSLAGVVVGGFGANFNLATGAVATIVSSGAMPTASIVLDGGFYKCTVTPPATETGISNVQLFVLEADTGLVSPSTTGTAKSVIVGSAMLQPAGTNYQRVVDANTYDTAGFPLYLKFDGVDDSMATAAINFSGTSQVTVWAGATRLATGGIVAELSSTVTNPGAFSIYNGVSTPNTFEWFSGGTALAPIVDGAVGTPKSSVLCGQGNITAPTSSLRENGAVAGSNATTQGTGAYGNYPLYLGARAGSSLFFNGRLYGLVVRGAQSTAAQVTAGETYMNAKSGGLY